MGEEADTNGSDRMTSRVGPARGAAFGRALRRALENANIAVLFQDRNLRYTWVENPPDAWTTRDFVGLSDHDMLPQQEAERLTAAKMLVLEGGQPSQLEIAVGEGGETRWFEVWIDADESEQDGETGLLMTVFEITEQKQRERALKALLREVSHRSKNLLAIIQSVATQTGRYSGTIAEFLLRFRGRIQSLASSQDLVTSSNWRGADLHELATGQLMRYCADPVRNIHLSGDNPYLTPNAALHIGLALHELAVNSASHGALSRPEGRISLTAHTEGPADSPRLVLVWSEETGAGGKDPGQRRFGSVALERVVPAALNGEASLSFADDHLEYRLSIPRTNYEFE